MAAAQQGFDWMKFLAPGVGSVLGGIGGLFAGKSDDEKRREDMYNRLKGMLGQTQQPINTGAYLNRVQGSLAPQLNQIAGRASQRVGLDSGAAQGEIARANYGALQGAGAQYQMQGEQMQQQKLMQLLQMMAGLGG
jgi:hypothetical protein